MRHGRSLQEIAAELDRQLATKKDYVAPNRVVTAEVVDGDVMLDGLSNGSKLGINNTAHGQLATKLQIPREYYDRMLRQAPDLLAHSLNTWLHANGGEQRMWRALDGKVRANLSPRYRALDYYDLAEAVFPVLQQKRVKVMSAELTEKRFYIKGILEELSDQLPDGLAWGEGHHRVDNLVVAAITISNSEVGEGTLSIEPSVYTTWCENLAVLTQRAMKKYHVGRSSLGSEESFEVFRDATRRADDKAFFMKVTDITSSAFNEDAFRAAIADIKATVDRPIKGELPAVVEKAVEVFSLPPRAASGILTHLAKGGDLSQWGLSSAITRASQDDGWDYETATEFEHVGGEVLALPPAKWDEIADAKPVEKKSKKAA